MSAALHKSGKLGNRRELNTLGGLTYLIDTLTNTKFLVDTGAAVSVLPHHGSATPVAGSADTAPALTGADGRRIPSWGKIYRTVRFGDTTFQDVPFILWRLSPSRSWDPISSQNIAS